MLNHRSWEVGRLLGLLVLFFAFLASCVPEETNLTFEVLEQKTWGDQQYESREPGLLVIANAESIQAAQGLITEEEVTRLKGIDYSSVFAVVVFQGLKPTDGYKIDVERVAQRGEKIVVYVKFIEPASEIKKNDIMTSPYIVIVVQWSDSLDKNIPLEVVMEDQAILSSQP